VSQSNPAFCWTPNRCLSAAIKVANAGVISWAVPIMASVPVVNLKYFGYKLVIVRILKGLPVVYDLVPANLGERLAAEAIINLF